MSKIHVTIWFNSDQDNREVYFACPEKELTFWFSIDNKGNIRCIYGPERCDKKSRTEFEANHGTVIYTSFSEDAEVIYF